MTPVELVLSKLSGVKQCPNGWTALCPAHDDRRPSLSISESSDGKVLLKCFANCSFDSILSQLGLQSSDLKPKAGLSQSTGPKGNGKVFPSYQAALATLNHRLGPHTNLWTYHSADGEPVGVVVRWDLKTGKEFRPISRVRDGWVIRAMTRPRPLYNLPALKNADRVIVCEGEKAASAAIGLGLVATTSAGGSSAPNMTDWTPLAGKVVWIIPDHDEPGRKCAETVAAWLVQLKPAPTVKNVQLPKLPEHGDLVDWLDAQGDAAEPDDLRQRLERIADETRRFVVATEQAAHSEEAWPDPVPLVSPTEVPQFPVDVFPARMRDFIQALAEEKQVPFDLPAMLVLGAAAAGIARKVTVSPWSGWSQEPTNLFVMCCLPPGERKSQTFSAVFAPLMKLESELRTRLEPIIRDAECRQRVAQKRIDFLELKISKSDDASERARIKDELRIAREEFHEIVVPAMPILRVDDDTPEMLAMELVKQSGRLMAASPEARTLENITRYSDTPNFDVFLKAHAGDDLRTGRVGRGRDVVNRPALTCVYSPQPCVLHGLGETQELRGRGFLARWFYSLPQSMVGYRKVRGLAMPRNIRESYEDLLLQIWQTDYVDPANQESHELTLSPEAQDELEKFERWKEVRLRPKGELAGFSGWANKLGGLCVRLMAIFHIADAISENASWERAPIPVATARRAITLCRDYAVQHARAAFGLIGASDAMIGARAILKWLRQRKDRIAEFSKRDAFNNCRGSFDSVDEMQPGLELLERHFLIRPRVDPTERTSRGRRPSPTYEVNPRAFVESDGNTQE